jgi:hypothetical protein
VYSALLPGSGELSATMMIEIEDTEQIKPILDRFMGVDVGEHVFLHVGRGSTPRVRIYSALVSRPTAAAQLERRGAALQLDPSPRSSSGQVSPTRSYAFMIMNHA